jgi:hypothetical protein
MIYKIENANLTDALVNGARIMVFSFDGTYVLVRSDIDLAYALESYDESNLSELANDPLYKQPCKDC